MGCLCCGAEAELGALCRSCAGEIPPCEGLIPEHLHSKVDSTDAEAWVIDGFGGAHAVAATSRVGRSPDSELLVLASSVSRQHAELRKTETGWIVHDLGSRNGTSLAGARIEGSLELPPRALLKVGDVALWFLAEAIQEPAGRPAMATAGKGRFVRCLLERSGVELCVVITDDDAAAGTVMWRPVGTTSWSERGLAPLEFQLLRVLCLRAHEEAGSPSSIRGCVPAKQLVTTLPFQSKYANQENVRQIVLRLRGVLTEIGVAGMLAVAPGRGYYLACHINQFAIH
jgi:hypothetical protein